MAASDSAEDRMNLAVLQQTDPYIKRIKANARHVTLYSFRSEANEWEKTDVEGTCFVYERSAPPLYGFMILNRLGRQNFIEPITPYLEFQQQEPFLLYRNPNAIYGIWFYEDKECKTLNELLNKLVLASKTSQQMNVQPNFTSATASSDAVEKQQLANVDIMSMLTKAQSDFMGQREQEPHVMTSHPTGHPVKPLPVKPGSNTQPAEQQSISVEDLFKNVDQAEQPQKFTNEALRRQISLPSDKVRTVSELEELEHAFVETSPTPNPLLLTPGLLTASSSKPPFQGLTPGKPFQVETNTELMSPMAFSLARKDSSSVPVAINPPQHFEMSESMLSGFQRRNRASDSSQVEPISALTKEQLKQALIHLLQTDDQFLQSLHAAYVQSLNFSIRR